MDAGQNAVLPEGRQEARSVRIQRSEIDADAEHVPAMTGDVRRHLQQRMARQPL